MNSTDTLAQILSITAPVFSMVLMGMVLSHLKLVDDTFVRTASNLIYRATMPTLFFLSIWQADLQQSLRPSLIFFMSLGTLLCFGLAWWWASRKLPYGQRGAFIQGSFRGNCGVLSFALVASYYGEYGQSVGGVLVGFTILLFNVLSVFTLSYYSSTMEFSIKKMFKEFGTNPLIIGVLLGLVSSAIKLDIPIWIHTSAKYFSGMTLPLALICVGATLSITGLKDSGAASAQATAIKVAIAPLVACLLAWVFGVEGRDLVILWMFLASPTAAASFAMALAAGADGKLAANIIALSTLVAMGSMTFGIYALRMWGH